MALKDLLTDTDPRSRRNKIIATKESILEHKELIKEYISFWREYPDIFIEFLCGDNLEKFKLYTYQRIFLRVLMRYRYVYCTAPRAYSKSFLSILGLSTKCILFPGSKLFITTEGKEQAARITNEKMSELCKLIPGLRAEINFDRSGGSKQGKDVAEYKFHNTSQLDIMAMKDSSRGRRYNGGLIEEVILVDSEIVNDVVIPTMNVDRRLSDGSRDEKEALNKSQIYITTAGFKDTFAYDKLIELLIQQIIDPKETFVFGASWRTPVLEGLLQKDYVTNLQLDGTYTETSFNREYESTWTGENEKCFFPADKFDKSRTLHKAEYKAVKYKRNKREGYYSLGVDVGRKGCTTEISVIKSVPQTVGGDLKSLVNIISLEDMHFEDQALEIKKAYYRYEARGIGYDANGLGIGLLDYLIKPQTDKDGSYYPPFGILNDEEGFYKKYRTDDMERGAIFIIKANVPLNSAMYSYVQAQLLTGRLRFLITEEAAKTKLLSTKVGQEMTPEQRVDYLKPYIQTSILRKGMLNLIEDQNQAIKQNIILKPINNHIPKDKFSSLCYGLYFIQQTQESKKRKKKNESKKLLLYN